MISVIKAWAEFLYYITVLSMLIILKALSYMQQNLKYLPEWNHPIFTTSLPL